MHKSSVQRVPPRTSPKHFLHNHKFTRLVTASVYTKLSTEGMETPSKPSSTLRMPLGGLDANSHLLSSRPTSGTTPNKIPSSAMKSNTFTTPGKGLYSLKDTITSSPAQSASQQAPTPAWGMYGEVQQTPSRSNEKRKEAPTSAARDEYDSESTVKQARFSELTGHNRRDSGHGHSRTPSTSEYKPAHSRQSSASGHGHKLFGEIATRVETEEDMDSSQGTIANSSFNDEDMADLSQLTAVSVPDMDGPAPAVRRTPSPENLRAVSLPLPLQNILLKYEANKHTECTSPKTPPPIRNVQAPNTPRAHPPLPPPRRAKTTTLPRRYLFASTEPRAC